ncbi:MAG: radical SAM protein [Planctomycetes bacterium]|nr:radical SAM protein [Planctomycetota bacterium]MBL7039054.1 radical SAM protein [Pirellulaceae bacterium]
MLTLINTNRMMPPIAPIGLDYVAGAVREAGHHVDMLDLCLAEEPEVEISRYFDRCTPDLVGLTFRNVDDCFWPSAQSFLPTLNETVAAVRRVTDAPIVIGGVGYSIFPKQIVEHTGADFGIWGDGEQALGLLLDELRGNRRLEQVLGLVYRRDGTIHANPPAWPKDVSPSTKRDFVDNAVYFRRGGQIGVETKRGCNRQCIYCADPLAKGKAHRLRDPAEVADEVASLLEREIDVLHLCDPEFNLPSNHAMDVCDELIRRGLGDRVRWYAYLAVLPFSEDLARHMRRAGCVGINFTSDAANPTMLDTYRQPHRKDDLARAVRLCRDNGIAVMLDMLLGGPGETPESVAETIEAFKCIDPDCAGASLGIRVYPGTAMASMVAAEGPIETNPSIRRRYGGGVDLLQPTFYISSALGNQPGGLVRDLIGGDPRFFPPTEETGEDQADGAGDHNYSENQTLVDAIAAGARGAYWDILRRLQNG